MGASCYDSNRYRAKVVRWIDGDTLELEVDLGQNIIIRGKYRLARIDAPEIKLYRGVTKEEKQRGLQLLERLRGMDLDIITISTYKKGKYGRYIIDIWLEDFEGEEYNLSDYLISEGLVESKEY